MSPGVLDRVSCLWLHGVARSARGWIEFVEVWDWGGVPSWNVSAVSFIFLSMLLVLVCAVPDGFSLGPEII